MCWVGELLEEHLRGQQPMGPKRDAEHQRWCCKSCKHERSVKARINDAGRTSCYMCGLHKSTAFGGHVEPGSPSKRVRSDKPPWADVDAWSKGPPGRESKELLMLRQRCKHLEAQAAQAGSRASPSAAQQELADIAMDGVRRSSR